MTVCARLQAIKLTIESTIAAVDGKLAERTEIRKEKVPTLLTLVNHKYNIIICSVTF